jgi:UDP-N-acetylglucosamine 2-epimerase (non-hydrolysing)
MERSLHIMSVVGARPNFMKIAPFIHAIATFNAAGRPADGGPTRRIRHTLVHTGQHYDEDMSATFFDTLDIPEPDVHLEIGSGSHAEQVGRTMIAFEKVVRQWKPDWVVVVGDVNATCACAITAKKEHVRLAHIEAGLRSFDLDMPEEINRMVTDRLSDLLFTTDELASENLRREGAAESKLRCVGNIMIDTLERHRATAERLDPGGIVRRSLVVPAPEDSLDALSDGRYAVLTLHRPSNVDQAETLAPLVEFLAGEVAARLPLVWTLHPRTEGRLREFGLWDRVERCAAIRLVRPLGYLEMLRLNMGARVLLTDSGGLQEECCVLGPPCITLRFNTERPITLRSYGGVSVLTGHDVSKIREALAPYLGEEPVPLKGPVRPSLWDGRTAERIVEAFVEPGDGGDPKTRGANEP